MDTLKQDPNYEAFLQIADELREEYQNGLIDQVDDAVKV